MTDPAPPTVPPSRTALVTGGTGGLGRSVVSAFLADGWRVVLPVRSGGAGAAGDEAAVAVAADLTDPDGVAAAVAVAAGEPDAPLRAVVNLVGGYASAGLVHETPVADFERMLSLNLRPTYLVTAAAVPHLVAAGGGSVVCVSSRAAVAPFAGAAGYITAKAAVVAFANAVAVEYRASGVRCNTVLPSVIDTPANREAQPDADYSRWVSPAELAAVILFLAGDASAPVSGASVPAYGRA
jgi:NAD(P)-dependent dehydrogenase (short-subunit alcohol dehydrogenase family)